MSHFALFTSIFSVFLGSFFSISQTLDSLDQYFLDSLIQNSKSPVFLISEHCTSCSMGFADRDSRGHAKRCGSTIHYLILWSNGNSNSYHYKISNSCTSYEGNDSSNSIFLKMDTLFNHHFIVDSGNPIHRIYGESEHFNSEKETNLIIHQLTKWQNQKSQTIISEGFDMTYQSEWDFIEQIDPLYFSVMMDFNLLRNSMSTEGKRVERNWK